MDGLCESIGGNAGEHEDRIDRQAENFEFPAHPLLLQDGGRRGLDHRGELRGIPVCEPDAAVRFAVAYARRLRRRADRGSV